MNFVFRIVVVNYHQKISSVIEVIAFRGELLKTLGD
jgi:hypothetical protein